MKKLFKTLLGCIIVVSLTGCGSGKNVQNVSEDIDAVIEQF